MLSIWNLKDLRHVKYDIDIYSKKTRDITYCDVLFDYYLLPGLTALENIELAGELENYPLDASELIREVGLEKRAGHYPNRLSG